MKKIVILLFIGILFKLYPQDDNVLIQLPTVDIKIEDTKKMELSVKPEEQKLPENMETVNIPRPDLTETIKIDLEKTLPGKIELPEVQKPIDALITLGYGLNNYFFADFSIFVKALNPNIAVHYLRESKEAFLFYNANTKNPSSLDDLSIEMIYAYKILGLGSELGYYDYSYKLQDKSIYDQLTKRIINADLSPSIKFNHQNDLTLRVLNTFLITNYLREASSLKRLDFGYLLNTDLVYNQIFKDSHLLTVHSGYDFNYLDKYINGDNKLIRSDYKKVFNNNLKAGVTYSTTIAGFFSIKASTDFIGMFKDTDFFWYILPFANLGLSYQNYFHFYVEGGASQSVMPDRYWYKNNDYVVYPLNAVPGYHWYVKTGIKGSLVGWINGFADYEFAYNQNGLDWKVTNAKENLYDLTIRSFYEMNLTGGLDFQVREYYEFKVSYTHHFMDKMHFTPNEEIDANMTWHAPKIGLSFFLDFNAGLFRLDLDNKYFGNLYLLNAGIDWSWHDKIGVGAKFNNILAFQDYEIMPGYVLPGFEFVSYVRLGF